MTLLQLCEPIFQYVCRVNRAARGGHHMDYHTTRGDIRRLLDQAEATANEDPGLRANYAKIREPLIYFVDSMIVESGINFAEEWDENRIAYEHNQLSGDEAFYDDLEEAMADRGPEAEKVLAFYYVCLGLGFTGYYTGDHDYIRQKMSELLPRVRSHLKLDGKQLITPDAYEHTDRREFFRPTSTKLVAILIAFSALALTIFMVVGYLFMESSDDLARALQQINNRRGG